MKHNTIKGFLVILSAILLGSIVMLWSTGQAGNTRLTELMVSAAEISEITSARTKVDEISLEDIRFDDYSLICDKSTHQWYYSLIEESSSARDPFVTVTSGEKISIVFEENTLDDELIAANEPLRFLIYTDKTYMEGEIVCTRLPLINIEVTDTTYALEDNSQAADYDSTNPLSLNDSGEPIKFADTEIKISVFDNRASLAASSRITESSARAHIRGSSSVYRDKKSYRVSLTQTSAGNNIRGNDVSLLGMRADDDWILYAAATEGSRLRNIFSTNLWNMSCGTNNPYGRENGDEGKYVELFINGEYWGLYALMYPMDSLQLSLKNTGNPETSDHFYQTGDGLGDPSVTFSEELVPGQTWHFEYRGAEKEIYTEEQLQSLRNFIELLNADDETFLKEYRDSVYLENAMDMWLFVRLTLALDNTGAKNVNFISIYDEEKKDYVMLFSPWDLDQTWGYNYVKGSPMYEEALDMHCLGISRLLALDTENTLAMLKERYRELRIGTWSNANIQLILGELSDDIWKSGAMYREAERWPSEDPWQQLTDVDAVQLKDYVNQQLEDMDMFMDWQIDGCVDRMKEYYGVE